MKCATVGCNSFLPFPSFPELMPPSATPPPFSHDPSTVPVFWLRAMAHHSGASPELVQAALGQAGVSPAVLKEDAKIVRQSHEAQFLEALALLTGDDLIGARIGEAHDPRRGSIVSYILFSCHTVRELLELCVQFLPLTRPMSRVRLEDTNSGARFVLDTADPMVRVHAQHMEFGVAALLKGLKVACGKPIRPSSIRFGTLRRHGSEKLAQTYRCPVALQADQTDMHFPKAVLDTTVQSTDENLLDHLTTYGSMLLSQRRQHSPGLKLEIENIAISRLAHGVPPLSDIAARLGTSQRTLSRRMSDSGLNYRRIIDELRCSLAKSYLADPEMSLAEIAFLLGFGDQSTFGTAFRRWTGVSPGHYRAGLKSR